MARGRLRISQQLHPTIWSTLSSEGGSYAHLSQTENLRKLSSSRYLWCQRSSTFEVPKHPFAKCEPCRTYWESPRELSWRRISLWSSIDCSQGLAGSVAALPNIAVTDHQWTCCSHFVLCWLCLLVLCFLAACSAVRGSQLNGLRV